MEEVTGSIPVRSTNQFKHLRDPPAGTVFLARKQSFAPSASLTAPQPLRRTS
jgi:hypothetical protein